MNIQLRNVPFSPPDMTNAEANEVRDAILSGWITTGPRTKKLEKKIIPENIDYDQVKSLRIEAVQKLKEFRPVSIGQASRISGVSPADISVLLVYLGGR